MNTTQRPYKYIYIFEYSIPRHDADDLPDGYIQLKTHYCGDHHTYNGDRLNIYAKLDHQHIMFRIKTYKNVTSFVKYEYQPGMTVEDYLAYDGKPMLMDSIISEWCPGAEKDLIEMCTAPKRVYDKCTAKVGKGYFPQMCD